MLNKLSYIELNKNTQKAYRFLMEYKRSRFYSIYYVYKNPSVYKERAERDCLQSMKAINGYGYKILGFNCMQFSCGYIVEENNKKYLIVERANNRYLIEYEV